MRTLVLLSSLRCECVKVHFFVFTNLCGGLAAKTDVFQLVRTRKRLNNQMSLG